MQVDRDCLKAEQYFPFETFFPHFLFPYHLSLYKEFTLIHREDSLSVAFLRKQENDIDIRYLSLATEEAIYNSLVN